MLSVHELLVLSGQELLVLSGQGLLVLSGQGLLVLSSQGLLVLSGQGLLVLSGHVHQELLVDVSELLTFLDRLEVRCPRPLHLGLEGFHFVIHGVQPLLIVIHGVQPLLICLYACVHDAGMQEGCGLIKIELKGLRMKDIVKLIH